MAKVEAKVLDYNASNKLIYLGKGPVGSLKSAATWQIAKYLYDGSGNLTDVVYADGDRSYDNVWDNRASLSYS